MSQITKALLKAASEAPKLNKSERNQHHRYNFVPIDTFYEVVAPVLWKNGLWWRMTEKGREVCGEQIIFTYGFSVMHEGGESIEDFTVLSVPQFMTGPQAAGAAQSYAVKCFLRALLGIATGEEDADSQGPVKSETKQVSAKPTEEKVAPAKVSDKTPTEGEMGMILERRSEENLPIFKLVENPPWALYLESFKAFVPYAKGHLMPWWKQNLKVIEAMKETAKPEFEALKIMFEEARKKEKLNG